MDGRGLSLRKRSARPKISKPQPLPSGGPRDQQGHKGPTAPSNASNPSLAPPSISRPSLSQQSSSSSLSRVQASGNTADYVKRRFSTRITNLPRDLDAPAVPRLPSVSPARSPGQSPGRARGAEVRVDAKALQNPNLNADQYVAQLLADASEHEIREFQQSLSKIKNRTSTDLQHSVYQNRSQFIKISQEADKLKTEMRTLRNLMSDLTNTLGQTNAALGIQTDNISAKRHANRSSVANLEAMWSSHLQELWRRVEGSQKFLPAAPGRHVLQESGRWVELNTATFRPRRRVHMVLLNDHLLIAVEKRKPEQPGQQNGNEKGRAPAAATQMVAEKCWPLQDVEMTDISLDPALANRRASKINPVNAINVRVGFDSYTYASMDPSGNEKNTFLARFRKALAELRKHLQGESNEDGDGLAKLVGKSGGGRLSLASKDTRASMLVEVDGKQKNMQWVEVLVDELDIGIALHQFENAVDRIETLRRVAKSNKNNAVIQDLVEGKIQEKSDRLARAIARQLVDTSNSPSKTRQNVGWLVRLGYEQRACEEFLLGRSKIIDTRLGQCTDTGDLHQYLYQISFIYFTLIKNTASIFQSCFNPTMSSACVKWAKEHVDNFNAILSRQMSKLEPKGEEWETCLIQAKEHAAILAEVGMDFSGLIDGKSPENRP